MAPQVWPRSQQFIKETFGGLAEETRRKIVHEPQRSYIAFTETAPKQHWPTPGVWRLVAFAVNALKKE
jgi:hypothetical protein